MTRKYLFSGQVQGVGFRFTVLQLAGEFPVTGFVRNLADGRVELVVSGDAESVTSLVAAVGQHFRGNIESVEQADIQTTEQFATFEIRNSV